MADLQLFLHVSYKGTSKLESVIGGAKLAYDAFPHEGFYSCLIDPRKWFCLDPLGEIIYCHHQVLLIALGPLERSN